MSEKQKSDETLPVLSTIPMSMLPGDVKYLKMVLRRIHDENELKEKLSSAQKIISYINAPATKSYLEKIVPNIEKPANPKFTIDSKKKQRFVTIGLKSRTQQSGQQQDVSGFDDLSVFEVEVEPLDKMPEIPEKKEMQTDNRVTYMAALAVNSFPDDLDEVDAYLNVIKTEKELHEAVEGAEEFHDTGRHVPTQKYFDNVIGNKVKIKRTPGAQHKFDSDKISVAIVGGLAGGVPVSPQQRGQDAPVNSIKDLSIARAIVVPKKKKPQKNKMR